jgi:hypothetical protein
MMLTTCQIRMYTSTYLCQLGLPHRDDFGAPVVGRYLAQARERGDARLRRFFGEGNEGWLASEEQAWAATTERERAHREGLLPKL